MAATKETLPFTQSLRAKVMLLLAAIGMLTAGLGSTVVYRQASLQLEGQLLQRAHLLAQSLNQAAMVMTDIEQVHHIIDKIAGTSGVERIAIVRKDAWGLIAGDASFGDWRQSASVLDEHSFAHLEDALDQGRFGAHSEPDGGVAILYPLDPPKAAADGAPAAPKGVLSPVEPPRTAVPTTLDPAAVYGAILIHMNVGAVTQHGVWAIWTEYAVVVFGSVSLIILLMYAFLDRQVIARVGAIHAAIRRRTESREIAALAPELGRDEIGAVAGAYNELILELTRREGRLASALERAESMSRAKSTFLAHMSHELRTPLNAVIGFSEAMSMGLLGPLGHARYGEYAQYIHRSGLHLHQVLGDILDIARIEAGRAELTEERARIEDIVAASLHLVQPSADSKRIALHGQVGPDLPELWIDPLKIRQVLINLLTNAVKFTPEGGRVSVGATLVGDGIEVAVTDTGVGIPAADRARVLEPFQRVDDVFNRRHEGTGLGLAISKVLVELHGGTLALESEVGRGTTVRLRLPSSRILPETPPEAMEPRMVAR